MAADYIVSDVHLGAVPEETERAFLAFLERVGSEARTLLIPGDLFDFWFEWGDIAPTRHFRVLAALRSLVDAGVPVTMIGGNHDAWGGPFLRERVGVDLREGPIRVSLGGRPALVAHGDGLGGGDLKYRMLRALLHSRGAIAAFRALHPELGVRLARKVSGTEAKAGLGDTKGRAPFIRRWALERLAEEPELAFVVCGHAHVPEIVAAGPERYYLNAGDWVDSRSYIVVAEGTPPELRRWGEPSS